MTNRLRLKPYKSFAGDFFAGRNFIKLGIAMALALAGQVAVAQTTLDEITVTATRMEETLTDVAAAITAFSD